MLGVLEKRGVLNKSVIGSDSEYLEITVSVQ